MATRRTEPFLYKKRTRFESEVNLRHCRALVSRDRADASQCFHTGTKPHQMEDGEKVLFCWQHHPDVLVEKEAREAASQDARRTVSVYAEETRRLEAWLLKEVLDAHKRKELPSAVGVVVDALLAHRRAKPS